MLLISAESLLYKLVVLHHKVGEGNLQINGTIITAYVV